MSKDPSSCVLCLKVCVIESVSGLCADCERETSQQAGTHALPRDPDLTRSQGPADVAPTLTAGFSFDTPGGTRLRPAPAGYDLFRYLGGGGMGDVYLAREHAAERTVAIKFLRSVGSPASATRFLTEIRALARLDHPNIVRFISVDLSSSDPHYTMEYAAGGTLTEHVKSEGPLPVREAAEVAIGLARGVQSAHDWQVLHRDIKPSNVVFADDGTPKVSDFGLAKRTDLQDDLTQSDQVVGTPAFMPPEQISREYGDFGPASDVYGLGATIYFMLTGHAPFEAAAPDEVMRQVRQEPPVRPRAYRPEIPLPLEAIVLKCLEKKPADRYPSAAELAADLQIFLDGGRFKQIRPRTRLRRAMQWVRRRRVGIGAAVLAVATIALAVRVGLGLNTPTSVQAVASHTEGEWIREGVQRGPVTLVPATDLPTYYRFPLEAVTLGPSTSGDKTCSYHAFHHGLVELSPSPGITEYRLEFEMQELKALGNAGVFDSIGFYFGYSTAEADGSTVHALFAATFADHLPANNPKLMQAGLAPVLFRKMGWVQNPGGEALEVSSKGERFVTFTPAKGLAGPWRKFRVDISPAVVHVIWEAEPGKPETLIHLSGDQMQKKFEELRKSLAAKAPAAAAKLPPWTPDRPFGVIASQAAIAIRNVTISPLPASPN